MILNIRLTSGVLILIIILSFLFSSSCEENETFDQDSTTLKYVLLPADQTSIDLNDDNIIDIMIATRSVEHWNAGEKVHLTERSIISNSPDVLISYGKDLYNLLLKDSVIDRSLIWTDKFLSCNMNHFFPATKETEWVGIQTVANNDTLYGWIRKSCNNFLEYAIDTSYSDERKIYAGSLEK